MEQTEQKLACNILSKPAIIQMQNENHSRYICSSVVKREDFA